MVHESSFDSEHEIVMYVKAGEEGAEFEINQDFENYLMLDGDEIEIHYQKK